MSTVQVYVVVGPTKLFMGGREVPGGFEYLSRNLFLLAELNKGINFEVRVAHSIYHGVLSVFHNYSNMLIEVREYDNDNFEGLSELDPIVQHGALLNKLFSEWPPTCRFVLILDPDCYVIQSNLISGLVQEMIATNLSVAGISYPAWYPKEYSWKTPQLYFCLFDREYVLPEKLDLRAGIHGPNDSNVLETRYESLTLKILRKTRSFLLDRGIVKFENPIEIFLRVKIDLLLRRFEIHPRDTGWTLGDKIEKEKLKFKVYPNILKREITIPGFNADGYLSVNQDLRHLDGNTGWYFLTQGLTEGRPLGPQGIFPRILKKFTGSEITDCSKWPPSSLLGALRVSNQDVFNLIQTAIPAADFYAVGNEFSLFHIGSKGKGQIHDEIKVLDNLICELISKSSEQGSLLT